MIKHTNSLTNNQIILTNLFYACASNTYRQFFNPPLQPGRSHSLITSIFQVGIILNFPLCFAPLQGGWGAQGWEAAQDRRYVLELQLPFRGDGGPRVVGGTGSGSKGLMVQPPSGDREQNWIIYKTDARTGPSVITLPAAEPRDSFCSSPEERRLPFRVQD